MAVRTRHSELSDAALVVAMARYDHDALAEIYRRHSSPTFGLARRILGDTHLAEDVVQEVFVELFEHPETFDASRGALRSLLLTMTHRRCVDRIRSEEARRRREDRHHPAAAPTQQAGVEEQIVALMDAEAARSAMDKLSDVEREVISLCYFAGKSQVEAARILGIPEGTVKSRLRTGLAKLRGSAERSVGVGR